MRKMKDSGVEWIGMIPVEWDIRKVRYCGALSGNGVDKKTVEGEPLFKSVHYMDVYRNSLQDLKNSDRYLVVSANESKSAGCTLNTGDVLITSSSETPEDIGHSTVVVEDLNNTLMGYHLMRFRPAIPMNVSFEKYLFGSSFMRSWFECRAYGMTRYGLNYSDFADAPAILPPPPEQQRIAEYLDRKCAKIDDTIDKQRVVIEKLKAYKQSVITHAVTKGLNPNAPMKDSGIEWIGKIPQYWQPRRLRFLCEITTGDKDTVNRNDDGVYPFYVRSPTVEHIDTYTFDGEAVLMAGDGVGAGKVFHYACGKFDYHQRVYNLHNFADVVGKYLFYFLRVNFWKKIEEGNAKSTVDSVRLPMLLNFQVAFGSEAEQREIADYLDKKCADIDTAIAKKEALIEKLAAFKKSLIYECVTGKREVV